MKGKTLAAWEIFAIILLIFGLVLFFAFGVYFLDLDNRFARGALYLLPLPAAAVNLRPVSLTDFYELRAILEALSGNADPAVLQKAVLGQTVENELERQLARRYGVFLTESKLNRHAEHWREKLAMAGNDLNEILATNGIAFEKFKNLIVLPDLRRSELAVSLLQSDMSSPAYRLAEDVQELLAGGLTFDEAAALYSQDEESKYIKGDLGFLGRDGLPYWLSDAAFDLEIGEISGVVASPAGYHILSVAATDEDSDPPRLQVRHILIRHDPLTPLLEDFRRTSRVYVFRKL